jgi:peptide/nickel transport system substrate-binding protein
VPRNARAEKRPDGATGWCIVCLLVVVLALPACRSAVPDGALVVGLESIAADLDPRFATDAASVRIGELVFRALTRLDEHQRHVPDLALTWKQEDPRTVRFELDPAATFSDGSPVTAADVRATYQSILDPATASPRRESLEFLEATETPTPRTIVFRLREPRAAFLSGTTIGIVPKNSIDTIGSHGRILVGSGPYRIAFVRPGDEIRLVARASRAGIPAIRFRVVPDDTVRTLELARGALDFVENAVEPDNLRWLETHAATSCVRRIPGSTFQYLGLSFSDERLADLRVRQALAHAIDRAALVDHLLEGTARVADGLLPPEHWAYEPNPGRYDYDPARARRLLDEAGYRDPDGDGPRMRMRLSYKTTTLASRRRMAEALQAMLAEVGIGLDLRSYEWATFFDDIRRGSFQLYSLAWVGASDPDFFFSLLHSTMVPPRGNNRGRFADAEIDRLTELGRIAEPATRQATYAAVQHRVAELLPFIPLWWTDNVVVQTRRLCGFEPRADGSLASLATARLVADPTSDAGCECGPGRGAPPPF